MSALEVGMHVDCSASEAPYALCAWL